MNPLDLPIHPAFVHFPLAMLGAAWICVLAQHLTAESSWDGRVRLFAIPGVAIVLPLVGAASDTFGIQGSVLTLVPASVVAGLILASAAPFVASDIAAVQAESLSRAAEAARVAVHH